MIKKNILVVEDNHAILDVITLILESEAFIVEGLNKGKDFIHHVENFKPDVIVMDIMLPDIDGRDLLSALRQNLSTANIPVLMISARFNKDNYSINNLMADAFMAKPFNIDELMDKVYELLKHS